jgi:2-amino-4-hydroxy-6-hydroxymethyldihydropteridine diphosphokinase
MEALWVPAYIAVGSNLDDPVKQVQRGLDALAGLPRSKQFARSRLYRTAPLGPQDQPEFVNAAAGLLTQLSPRELFVAVKQLELTLGRQPPIERWGPRRIDLDLIVFGAEVVNETDLVIPHPGAPVRNFVLYPLLDIAPDLPVPGHGRVRELAQRVGSSGLTRIEQ